MRATPARLLMVTLGLIVGVLPATEAWAGAGPSVFISEIHYDNVGGDVGEFVEVTGPAGTVLDGWVLNFYSRGGAVYAPSDISGTIDDEGGGYGAVSFGFVGLRSGTAGVALVDDSGSVIQFLSYGGVVTGADGPATGMTSEDIGVAEDGNTTPIGYSVQLVGSGTTADDFTWQGPADDSPGSINVGMTVGSTSGTTTTTSTTTSTTTAPTTTTTSTTTTSTTTTSTTTTTTTTTPTTTTSTTTTTTPEPTSTPAPVGGGLEVITPGQVKVWAGSTVWVKFRSEDGVDGATAYWATCGATDTSGDAVSGRLHRRAKWGVYAFSARTRPGWGGECRQLVVQLASGAVIRTDVQLKGWHRWGGRWVCRGHHPGR